MNTTDYNFHEGLLPDSFFDPRIDMANAASAQGHKKTSLTLFEEIGKEQSQRHFIDALALERKGDRAGAVASIKLCLKANPDNAIALVKLGDLTVGAESEKAYREALKVDPEFLEARLRLGLLLANRSQPRDVMEVMQDVQYANITAFDALFVIANIQWKIGNFPLAECLLLRCIDMNPNDIRSYNILIELYNRVDRIEDAARLAREYLVKDSGNRLMCIALASAVIRLKDWEEAHAVIGQLLHEHPADLEGRLLYASMLRKCGRDEDALEVHAKNVEIAPAYLESHLGYIDMCQRLGNRHGARDACRRIRTMLSSDRNFGLHSVPFPLMTRLVFSELAAIRQHYCTGTNAIIDNTGLDLNCAPPSSGEVVELFCMVVGQEHLDLLEFVAFPSLIETDGFAELQRERRVVYNFYTTLADFHNMQRLLTKLDGKGIKYRINIDLFGLSQELYAILCLPVIDQIVRSVELGSVVVFALPDVVITGSVARLISDMSPHETCVCALPRIDSSRAYPMLREHFENGRGRIQTRPFVRQCMNDFMHPQTFAALATKNPCLQYTNEGYYYSAHNWAPPPFSFFGREEMLEHMLHNPLCGPDSMSSFFTLDHDIVDSAYRNKCLRLIDTSDYFYWAELTGPCKHTDFLAGRKNEDFYYPESARHVYAHEFKWIYDDASAGDSL